MTFAERLKNRRVELSLTQSNVALLMNVAPQFVSGLEHSRSSLPFERVHCLSEALSLPTEVIVHWLIEDFKERLFQTVNKTKDQTLVDHFNEENNFELEAT